MLLQPDPNIDNTPLQSSARMQYPLTHANLYSPGISSSNNSSTESIVPTFSFTSPPLDAKQIRRLQQLEVLLQDERKAANRFEGATSVGRLPKDNALRRLRLSKLKFTPPLPFSLLESHRCTLDAVQIAERHTSGIFKIEGASDLKFVVIPEDTFTNHCLLPNGNRFILRGMVVILHDVKDGLFVYRFTRILHDDGQMSLVEARPSNEFGSEPPEDNNNWPVIAILLPSVFIAKESFVPAKYSILAKIITNLQQFLSPTNLLGPFPCFKSIPTH